MRNCRFDRRKIAILLCYMAVGCVLWYFWGPCRIVLIKDSLVVRYDKETERWSILDKCIVVRPTENLLKLREVFSEYDKKYPVDIGLVKQKIKEVQGQRKDIAADASIEYTRLFYKNTADTPLDWNGKRDENKDGMEAAHRQDLIGSIRWMKNDNVKQFRTTKRLDWNLYQTITFYKDGRTKFNEYKWMEDGIEYDLENWY